MSETKLTNAIVPEIFSSYTVEPSIYKARMYNAGIIEIDPAMSALLAGGGESYNLPFWQDVGGTSGDVPSESTAATINNLASAKQIFIKQVREKSWGANNLVNVFAGSNPMDALAGMVNSYWGSAYDQIGFSSLKGVIADNIANDSGDLVYGDGTETFAMSGIVHTQAKLGENGVTAASDLNGGGFAAMLVHPDVYFYMEDQDLFDTVPLSTQLGAGIRTYKGMAVIADRNCYKSTSVYYTYLVKRGALRMGITSTGYMPTEIDRDPSTGFGIDKLYTRRAFAIHPVGTAFDSTSVAGVSPTDTELGTASFWNRVAQTENMPLSVYYHTLPAAFIS